MRISLFPAALLSTLFAVALLLTGINLQHTLPLSQWSQALFTPDTDAIHQMVFHYSLLPRLALALLLGAGLGLAGLLL